MSKKKQNNLVKICKADMIYRNFGCFLFIFFMGLNIAIYNYKINTWGFVIGMILMIISSSVFNYNQKNIKKKKKMRLTKEEKNFRNIGWLLFFLSVGLLYNVIATVIYENIIGFLFIIIGFFFFNYDKSPSKFGLEIERMIKEWKKQVKNQTK